MLPAAPPTPLKLEMLPLITNLGFTLPEPSKISVRPVADVSERRTELANVVVPVLVVPIRMRSPPELVNVPLNVRLSVGVTELPAVLATMVVLLAIVRGPPLVASIPPAKVKGPVPSAL